MDLSDTSEPLEMRVKQAKALAKDPSPRAIDVLLSGLDSKDETLRAAIRESLLARQAEPELLQRAADPARSASQRVAAFTGIRLLKPDAAPLVAALLLDGEEAIRAAAAHALCVLKSEGVEQTLIERLAAEPSAKVRYFLAVALGNAKTPKAKNAIAGHLTNEKDAVVLDALEQAHRKQSRPAPT